MHLMLSICGSTQSAIQIASRTVDTMSRAVSLCALAVLTASASASSDCSSSREKSGQAGLSMLQRRDTVEKGHLGSGNDGWINVCYFTNWARYRTGLVNEGRDAFEMGLDGSLCTHFMYGFATVTPDFMLKSNDPNADHPSGSESQDGLCPEECNDPSFRPDWSDPNGVRCEWPCSATRVRRGYEALTVGMKQKNSAIKALISVGGWNFNDCTASSSATYGQGAATCELFSEIAADEGKTRTFAANIIAFCRKWGFDGFDLDWEYPVVEGHNRVGGGESPQDYANYVRMLRILKEEFQKESSTPLLLTAAVGVGKSTADTAYDIPGMSQYLDLINLMTYDLHGSWEATTGCNAPLYATAADELKAGYPLSVSWAVDYWLEKGAPASKLTLGSAALLLCGQAVASSSKRHRHFLEILEKDFPPTAAAGSFRVPIVASTQMPRVLAAKEAAQGKRDTWPTTRSGTSKRGILRLSRDSTQNVFVRTSSATASGSATMTRQRFVQSSRSRVRRGWQDPWCGPWIWTTWTAPSATGRIR
ncbi:CHIT1 [Symbiodinium sp. CCMP2592]|nr:CHIT1 [Symbiodinium sp. CCMP2592]